MALVTSARTSMTRAQSARCAALRAYEVTSRAGMAKHRNDGRAVLSLRLQRIGQITIDLFRREAENGSHIAQQKQKNFIQRRLSGAAVPGFREGRNKDDP